MRSRPRPRRQRPSPASAPASAEPRLTSRQAIAYTAAALIFAAIHLLFAAVPLSLPLGNGLSFQVAPGLVVPLFMGLIGGPVAGLWVGLAGRFLGDLLAGAGVNGVGLLYTGVLGLIAGLGYRRPGRYRTLRGLLRAGLWVFLAAAGAGLAGGLANYLSLPAHDAAAAINEALSSAITAVLTGWLLLPALLALRREG